MENTTGNLGQQSPGGITPNGSEPGRQGQSPTTELDRDATEEEGGSEAGDDDEEFEDEEGEVSE